MSIHCECVIGLRLLLLLALLTAGCSGPRVQDFMSAEADEAYRTDARAYGDEFDVAPDEAVDRLKLQNEVSALNGQLQIQEADTFAGLWIEQEPEFKVVVLFTVPNGAELLRPYIQYGPLAGLVEVRTASRSLAELSAIQERAARLLIEQDVLFESEINIPQNRIELSVNDERELSGVLEIDPQLLDEIMVIEEFVPEHFDY